MGGRRAAAVLVAAALAGACSLGSDGGSAGDAAAFDPWPAGSDVPATPITVGWIPEGYVADIAAEGEQPPLLSDDTAGTIEPSLLLAPEGWDGSIDGVVAVAAVECANVGCDQALGLRESHDGRPVGEELDVEGRPAVYREGFDGGVNVRWPQVSVELPEVEPERETAGSGPAWALRVSSPTADRAVLIDVVAAASLDADRLPVLSHVPDGWQVVSRATASQLDAADGHVVRWPDGRVGADGYVLTWRAPSPTTGPARPPARLQVLSVDGSEANLAAVAALRGQATTTHDQVEQIERIEVGGRPAWRSVGVDSTTIVHSLDGGGVVAVTAAGDGRLSDAELERVAAGIEEIDRAAWEARVAGDG